MVEVIDSVFGTVGGLVGGEYNLLLTLLFFTGMIVIYAIFTYYFYKSLSKKNLIGLNLRKYNQYSSAGALKFFAFIFYVVEYVVILPIITFVWFVFLAVLLFLLSSNLTGQEILVIAAALVASVRIIAYIHGGFSQELAKMLPIALLGLALTEPEFFSISSVIERFSEIPSLISIIPYFIIFIVAVELIMRFSDIFRLFSVEGSDVDTDEAEPTQ